MKTATVREVQHNLRRVLEWVEEGQEVQITRRNRVVARIVPADAQRGDIEWPDFVRRATEIWGKRVRGKPVSQIIIDDRH